MAPRCRVPSRARCQEPKIRSDNRISRRPITAACVHAALGGLAGRDGSGVSAAEAVAAMAALREAVAMGERRLYRFRTADALDPLRGRDDFRLLMMDLTFPTEPFATAR
jgi:hypothetical protein